MKLRSLLLVFALGLVGLSAGCMNIGASPRTITAMFSDTSGLFLGNDVGVLGVRIGKITKIKPIGTQVAVTLEIDSKRDIPADAKAVIVSRSVATNRYVELTPVYTGGDKLKAGDVIPLERTRTPVEFDDLVKALTDFGNALVGPNANTSHLRDLFQVTSNVVKGNGQRLHDTITNLSDALNTISGQSSNISATLNSLDQLTTQLATNDSTVRQFSETVTQATTILADQHQEIQAALDSLDNALVQLANFTQKHKTDLTSSISDLSGIAQAVLERRAQLEEMLQVLPLGLQNVRRAAVPGTNRLEVRLPPAALSVNNIALTTLCNQLPAGVCSTLNLAGNASGGLLNLGGVLNLGGH